jgi:hypothetical protein
MINYENIFKHIFLLLSSRVLQSFLKQLECKPFQKTACPQAFSKNCFPASLFKKGLSENDLLRHCRFGQAQAFFEKGLIENPWKRRDQTAQFLTLTF